MTTLASYDIVGNLLGLNTTLAETSILSLGYGYDQNSSRVGMVAKPPLEQTHTQDPYLPTPRNKVSGLQNLEICLHGLL